MQLHEIQHVCSPNETLHRKTMLPATRMEKVRKSLVILPKFYHSLRHCATSWKVIRFFNWPNPSSCTMALRSTQPLTEMSTRNLHVGKGQLADMADNLTTTCDPNCLKNVGASVSHKPMVLHGLLQGKVYVFFFSFYLYPSATECC
jgi:hypothetical protein